MSLERAKAYLKEYKMEDQINEFPVSSATVELAAEALHTEAGRIAKTLSFLVDGEAVLIGQNLNYSQCRDFLISAETLIAAVAFCYFIFSTNFSNSSSFSINV